MSATPLQRIGAMVFKEVRQMLRDRGTVGMMLVMPLMQLMIFGYAINNDPRGLPMAIERGDSSVFARSIDAALRNTTYFKVTELVETPGAGDRLLQDGKVHPAFNRSGTSFKLRSGVGVCRDGRVRFAVSAGPVNFYSFAVFFRDTLGCPDALYLDGSISAYATADRSTQLAEFAGIWSVSR